MSRYYIFFDVYLQFYDMAPYWVVLENGIWKNAPRTDTESAPWSTPTRFFFKIVTILIYNKLFVLLLYKVNIKQTFFLLLVTK